MPLKDRVKRWETKWEGRSAHVHVVFRQREIPQRDVIECEYLVKKRDNANLLEGTGKGSFMCVGVIFRSGLF